ncbi:hypothetical protein [Salinibacter phage M8CR30-4]|uniref:Uncharacterized protein n=1 Tax=Salinibacter phage M8CR30-4 TaxID=2041856 RepID=A0A2I6UGJ8_9CAUD|nr:hypothetical protein [Salinibacter phage M8CR30-4]
MAEILSQSAQDELLSSKAQAAGDLAVRVELAEIRVLGRYKEDRDAALDWYFEGRLDPSINVDLYGYREDEDGNFDPEASNDELVRRLRLVVAQVVNWSVRQEQTTFLDRERVGQKAVAYSDVPEVPTRLFQPLNDYDEREPFHGF